MTKYRCDEDVQFLFETFSFQGITKYREELTSAAGVLSEVHLACNDGLGLQYVIRVTEICKTANSAFGKCIVRGT